MSTLAMAALSGVVLYFLSRFLHLTESAYLPRVYVRDRSSEFVQLILSMCPILTQPYIPPFLWGKSGHLQTLIYAKKGHGNHPIPVPGGVRHIKIMDDGATLTFDLFEPSVAHKTGGSYCFLICPGIGNSSESAYVRMLVKYALKNGYICAVLNHIGALSDQDLSAPRIFTYGGTEELSIMRYEVEYMYPQCNLILVGLSMGANIVVKYLGESQIHQKGIVAAMSICQGYDVNKAAQVLLEGDKIRRGYIYAMTSKQKSLMTRHKDVLFSEEERTRTGVDLEKVLSASSLPELDEAYTMKRFGYACLDDFYSKQSSSNFLLNVHTPLLIVNAEDDPIVPEALLEYPLKASQTLPNCIYVLTKHGGHLGYFENGWIFPDQRTWMERVIIDYADAVTTLHNNGTLDRLLNAHGHYLKFASSTQLDEPSSSKLSVPPPRISKSDTTFTNNSSDSIVVEKSASSVQI